MINVRTGILALLVFGALVDRCGGQTSAPSTRASTADELMPALPVDESSAAEMLSHAGEGAGRLETEHFLIVYTGPPPAGRDLGARLERVYHAHLRFIREFALKAHRAPYKLEVYCFARYAEFQAHLEDLGVPSPGMLGLYDPTTNRAAFFDLDAYPPLEAIRATADAAAPEQRAKLRKQVEERRTALALRVIQHEAAHQIQRNLGLFAAMDQIPPWLAEGLATLFEVPCDPDGRPRAAVNAYRLYEFRKLYGKEPEALRDLGRWLVDDAAWCGGRCYPWAWAVTRFLRDDFRAGFAALLRRVGTQRGLPAGAAERRAIFDDLFGPVDARWIERLSNATLALPVDAAALEE